MSNTNAAQLELGKQLDILGADYKKMAARLAQTQTELSANRILLEVRMDNELAFGYMVGACKGRTRFLVSQYPQLNFQDFCTQLRQNAADFCMMIINASGPHVAPLPEWLKRSRSAAYLACVPTIDLDTEFVVKSYFPTLSVPLGLLDALDRYEAGSVVGALNDLEDELEGDIVAMTAFGIVLSSLAVKKGDVIFNDAEAVMQELVERFNTHGVTDPQLASYQPSRFEV